MTTKFHLNVELLDLFHANNEVLLVKLFQVLLAHCLEKMLQENWPLTGGLCWMIPQCRAVGGDFSGSGSWTSNLPPLV